MTRLDELAIIRQWLTAKSKPTEAWLADLRRVDAELNTILHMPDPLYRSEMNLRYAVYPGAEKLDIGPKRPTVLCESQPQAEHMAKFWAPYGYSGQLSQKVLVALYPDGDEYKIR